MSGWLPPGVTDKDIDEASPGYWENDQERAEWEEEQQRNDMPETMLRDVDEIFCWLCANGYRKEAQAKWEEIGIALHLLERLSGAGAEAKICMSYADGIDDGRASQRAEDQKLINDLMREKETLAAQLTSMILEAAE